MDMWLTDTDIEAVLDGEVPPGRPDLADLSAALECLREEFPSQPVTCSDELAAIMRSTGFGDAPSSASVPVHRRMLRWAAGLGVAGQTALASTGAAAVIAAGGLTGVLPDPAQRVFDDFVHRQEEPPATSPSAPAAPAAPVAPVAPVMPGRATSQDGDDRRETSLRDTPADQRPAQARRNSRDRGAIEATRQPTLTPAVTGVRQVPTASGDTGDSGGSTQGSDGPVVPKRPTTPAEEPDDDLDDHKDDYEDDLEDAEDEERDRVEEDTEDAADRAEDSRDTAEEPRVSVDDHEVDLD